MRICSEARYPYARTRTLKPLWEGITGSCGWPGQIVGIQQVYNPRCSKSKAKAGERRVFGDLDDTRSWKSSGRFCCRSGDGARGCAVCSSAGADRSRRSAALARFAGRERAPRGRRAGASAPPAPAPGGQRAGRVQRVYRECVIRFFRSLRATRLRERHLFRGWPDRGRFRQPLPTTASVAAAIFGAQFSS